MEKKQVISVAGCLVKNGQVLMLKNIGEQIHNLPQGLVEFDENPDDAIMRIFQDQTGLVVEPITPFRVHSFTLDNLQNVVIHYLLALVDDEDDEYVIDENEVEINWLDAKRIEEERPNWEDEIRQSVEIAIDLDEEKIEDDMLV